MNTLFWMIDEKLIAYPQSCHTRYADTPNIYSPGAESAAPAPQLDGLEDVASVRNIAPDVWSVVSHAQQKESDPLPTDFREVLRSWEHTWLWEDFCIVGDHGWIAETIRDETLMTMTDGSYIKEIFTNVSTAAYILEC